VARKEQVSVNWQSLSVIIILIDLFAAYRVEKLRLFLLIFYLGFGLGSVILEALLFPEAYFSDEFLESSDLFTEDFLGIGLTIRLIAIGLAIILIRKWSREWNERVSHAS